MKIGKAIKLLRVMKGMGQVELSEKAGLHYSYISLVETNKRNISLPSLEKIAKCLNKPVFIICYLAQEVKEIEGISQDLNEMLSYEALK